MVGNMRYDYFIQPKGDVKEERVINPILKNAINYTINPTEEVKEYLIKPSIVSEYLINPILKNAINYTINPTEEVRENIINPNNGVLEYIIKPTASFYIHPNGNVDDFKIIPYYKLFGGGGAPCNNNTSNHMTTFVGDEIFLTGSGSGEEFKIPDLFDIIDYPFNNPNFDFPNIKIHTGYLYFNLRIESFGYGLWRGSTLCSVPNHLMVFPSAYAMNGKTYWGTDIQPSFGSVKNSYIGFFGSILLH